MRICQSHISYYPSKKPSAYGIEGALDPVYNIADDNIDTLLPFGNLITPDSFVHDATFELHLSERLPVFYRIVAFIGIDGCPLWEVGFLQGRFKILDVALVGLFLNEERNNGDSKTNPFFNSWFLDLE